MTESPKYPWRIDTNDRYRDLVSLVISLAVAALLVPVFLAREFLGIPETKPLISVFSLSAYLSWLFLGASILCGLLFYMFSAKWIRLAWGQSASIDGVTLTDETCEKVLEWSLWLCVLTFVAGLASAIWFFVAVTPAV
jgi:hypothetical protein